MHLDTPAVHTSRMKVRESAAVMAVRGRLGVPTSAEGYYVC